MMAQAESLLFGSMLKYGVAGALAASGCWIIYRMTKSSNNKLDQQFSDELLTDVAGWLAAKTSQPQAPIMDGLRRLVAGNPPADGAVANVLRIDYELTKLTANKVQRIVAVGLKNDTSVSVGKITREYRWEYLPEEFRNEFVRNGNKSQARCLCERKKPQN